MRRSPVLIAVLAVVAGALAAGPAATAAPGQGGDGLEVYVGEVDAQQLQKLADIGVDRDELTTGQRTASGKARVEVVITDRQAAKLRTDGVDLKVKKVKGRDASDEAARARRGRPHGLPLVQRARRHRRGAERDRRREPRGWPSSSPSARTVQGKPILAVKVTKNARQLTDGARPSVLYMRRPARP